jgi:hypothetical protein
VSGREPLFYKGSFCFCAHFFLPNWRRKRTKVEKRPLRSAKNGSGSRPVSSRKTDTVSREEFSRLAADWLADCEYRQHSKNTVTPPFHTGKSPVRLWVLEIRQFFGCSSNSHHEPLRSFKPYANRCIAVTMVILNGNSESGHVTSRAQPLLHSDGPYH